MKPFETLTEAELVGLTEDEVQRYIDYACAEAGVPLLPACVPEPPKTEIPEPDQTVYIVGNAYSTDIVCPKQADAQRVADVLNAVLTCDLGYVPGPSTERMVTPHHGAYLVRPERVYSSEVAAKIRPALEDAQRAQRIYDAAKKEYDRAVAEREAYASAVRDAVEAAHEVHQRREARRRDFARYLELADGRHEIAVRFLAQAHRDAQELLPELFVQEVVQA